MKEVNRLIFKKDDRPVGPMGTYTSGQVQVARETHELSALTYHPFLHLIRSITLFIYTMPIAKRIHCALYLWIWCHKV